MKPRIALVTLYTDNIRALAELTNPSKEAYCRRWGYDFICHEGTLDPSRPPAWSKIRLLLENLGDYDWLYWLDADALVMNPEVALESFCDERYSLVVAQLEEKDLFGDLHLNTGSFFVRNDEWGRRILEAVDGTAQEDSPCWEQKAFVDLFTTQSWVRERVRVETESWRFNAFLPTYRKGDFVFHALGPIRTLEGKIDLIRQVMAEDHQIDFPNDPLCRVLLVPGGRGGKEVERGHVSLERWPGEARQVEWERLDAEEDPARLAACLLREMGRPGVELLVVSPAESLYFPRWKRRLMIALGRADALLVNDGGAERELLPFLVLRNTSVVRKLLEGWCRGIPSRSSRDDHAEYSGIMRIVSAVADAEEVRRSEVASPLCQTPESMPDPARAGVSAVGELAVFFLSSLKGETSPDLLLQRVWERWWRVDEAVRNTLVMD